MSVVGASAGASAGAGGGFQSRMQNKQQPVDSGQIGGGIPNPSKIGGGGTGRIGGGAPTGISSNSFRARI